jgi:hypothetical protein
LSFYEGAGVGDLKIEELESEGLCTHSTVLFKTWAISATNMYIH